MESEVILFGPELLKCPDLTSELRFVLGVRVSMHYDNEVPSKWKHTV